MGYLICGIYENRPEMCKRYPESGSYVTEQCSFYFADGERKGECDPDCQASCCMLPRHQGEPTGPAMPEIAGGLPCKHVVYSETHPALPGNGEADTAAGGDRAEDKSVPDPIELVLAEIDSRKGDRSRLEKLGGDGGPGEGGEDG